MTEPELSVEQAEAVVAYATEHGRNWKARLRDDWMRAATPGPLQRVRNTHGPAWLVKCKLDDIRRIANAS